MESIMKMFKHPIITFVILLFLIVSLNGRENKSNNRIFSFNKTLNSYPDVNLDWIGIGQLTTFCITNTGTHGLWVKPDDWSRYDATFPDGTFSDGQNAEWPAGTNQTYNYAASFWVGGEVPIGVNPTTGDTTWGPRVDTGTYTDEWGTVTPLYSSIQVFPSSDLNAGENVYKQKYRDREDYQQLWPYLDLTVNARRPSNLQLSAENGDFVSEEDTYCEYGSFMSIDSAVWIDPATTDYDTKPLGVYCIQRTYSWSTSVAEDALIVDLVIENRNDFPIRNLYVGYFMDNDIGYADIDEPGAGSNDDLIGFDPSLSLGYTFDSNFYEKDWVTPAGYIGAVWLKGIARNDLGSYLTGFQTWTREGSDESNTDQPGNDLLKYRQLNNALTSDPNNPYETFDNPQDVRMLLNTGPRIRLNPGERDTVTVAIVMGESLSDLRQNTINIQQVYDQGYVLPEAPPSPKLTAYPADRKVYLSWDNFSESVPDPFTGEVDFEGYRVYKSETGLADDWNLLSEYDIYGTETANSVITRVAQGNTTARFYFLEFAQDNSRLQNFKGDQSYSINFTTDSNFVVINNTTGVLYQYSKRAYSPAPGLLNTFTVVAKIGNNWTPLPFAGQPATTDPNYNVYSFPPNPDIDSTIVYFDGMFFVLGTGPEDPAGQATRDPKPGDVLEIESFRGGILGNETGLNYSFIDEDVKNGLKYYYAVTSFDRGNAKLNLPSLESPKRQNQVEVVPVTPASTGSDPAILEKVIEGPVSGEVFVNVIQPLELTGHQYEITFFDLLNPPYNSGKYWRLTDLNASTVLLDSMTNVFGTRYDINAINPPTDGFLIRLDAPNVPELNRSFSGWSTSTDDSLTISTRPAMEPYDFELLFYSNPVDVDTNNVSVSYEVFNTTLNVKHQTRFFDVDNNQQFSRRDSIRVFGKHTSSPIFSIVYTNYGEDTSAVGDGDKYELITNKPFQTNNRITFKTTGPKIKRADVDLSKIRVVPNPYYIRAYWDQNRYDNNVMFTNLPEKCTIRIFTISGILIKEIDFDANSNDPNVSGGSYMWNLRNLEELKIASGLYIFQVESDVGTQVGKFAIVR
jgi:hypothetical protein